MKFVIVFGPLAVGKMTVGQELEKITDLRLFHNHMTIEMVLPFFDMKSPSFKKLVNSFRIQMFEEVAKSNLAGLIFTYVWKLDQKKDCDFIDNIVRIFERENASGYYVELEADVEERLKRNKSANRLKHKPSKIDLKASTEELLETDRKHVLNSKLSEFQGKRDYFKINNTRIDASETARMIKERFDL
ncbi:MAG: AAA family ATPase [Planctomycetes bacterium]|nr:AAA family ATPase [Planctomycetota bacterium]